MKIVRSWLAEFVDLGTRSNQELAETLENLGHEVEAVENIGQPETVVVGHVLEVSAHPNADRLRVALVDTGDAKRTIVCGAPNVAVGQKVPVALVGTSLPNGLTIEKCAIRGVESDGMICAADELGLSADHSGILVLADDRIVGQPFQVGVSDAVFTLAITANRGDVLSHAGVARELAAKWRVSAPRTQALSEQEMTQGIDPMTFEKEWHEAVKARQAIPAGIRDSEACPYYTARRIAGIQKKSLPAELSTRLALAGHHFYHPIVDIANYVMEELGVPLHAFDAAKITGKIMVRPALQDTSITLLDGKTYQLEPGMLVIADGRGPIALAGVMGGRDSAVSDETTDIILEAAYFQPSSIRRTRTKLGLQTDAAYRFERGTDPFAAIRASNRAAELIKEHLGGQVGPRFDTGVIRYADPIRFDPESINARLGATIDESAMVDILERLGFQIRAGKARPPSWRHDIAIPEDLAEEIARVYGYDNLPRTMLAPAKPVPNPDDERWFKIEQMKDLLAGAGWTENIGSSFLSGRERELLKIPPSEIIKLANPVSEEAAYLRPTQMLSLLKMIAKNPIFSGLKVFEIGTVWKVGAEKNSGEQTALTLAWTGTKPIRLPGTADREFGTPVDQELLNKLKIRRPVMVSEVPIELVVASIQTEKPVLALPRPVRFRQPSRFQPVLRDIAILVDTGFDPVVIAGELLKIDSVVDVELFDQFTGGKLPAGKQSLAYHLLLEHPDRALDTEEIGSIMKEITDRVVAKFNAELR